MAVMIGKQFVNGEDKIIMTNLLEKARAGRTNALAGLAANIADTSGAGSSDIRFRASARGDTVTFISRRAQAGEPLLLH